MKPGFRLRVSLLAFLTTMVATVAFASPQAPGEIAAANAIRSLVEEMHASPETRGRWLVPSFLATLYEHRQFSPLWTSDAAIDDLLEGIEESAADGLDPEEYHLDEIQAFRGSTGATDPVRKAKADLLMTDAMAALGYHLRFGKVDPVSVNPHWNVERPFGERDPVSIAQDAVSNARIRPLLASLRPQSEVYAGMRRALLAYREIERGGGWDVIPPGPTLQLEDEDGRVADLARRLQVTDGLDSSGYRGGARFDRRLEEAVIRFQDRHGLQQDGLVGKDTLTQLNVSVTQRIDQLRVNLERARWLLQIDDPDAVIVNVGGFRLFLRRGGRIVWQTRVVVGLPYRRTPLFRDRITYLVLNPDWTAPYSISTRDILPRLLQEPDYLREQNMIVLDGTGRQVDASTIDWASLSRSNFPYVIRQLPGPKNALGRVKFMFPNQFSVYLHDTPSTTLFERDVRAFSSGCIRVEDPLTLAELLLDDQDNWGRAQIDERLASGRMQTVNLENPISVYLVYWTSGVRSDGAVTFFQDVYQRDPAVLKSLDAPFWRPDAIVGASARAP